MENYHKISSIVRYNYSLGSLAYVKNTGIYQNIYNKKIIMHRTIDGFTSGDVWFKRGHINEHINIRILEPHFICSRVGPPGDTINNDDWGGGGGGICDK